MTIGAGGLLLFLLAPLLLGAAALAALGLRPRDDRLAYVALCHVAGTLLVALLLGTTTRFGLALTLPAVVSLIGGATLVLGLLARVRPAEPRVPIAAPAGTRPGRVLFGCAVALSLWITFDRALIAGGSPMHFGDETTIWNSKAKSLWFAGGINDRLPEFVDQVLNVHQADYPMLLPWNMVWVDLCAGAPTDIEARWPAQLAMAALMLVAAWALRRRVPPALAALLLLALVMSRAADVLTGAAFADGLVALGVLILFDAWMRFEQSGERRYACLAAVGAAYAMAAKNEGTLIVAAFTAAVVVVAVLDRPLRARLRALGWTAAIALLPAAAFALQKADNARFAWTNDLTGSGVLLQHNLATNFTFESVAAIGRFLAETSLTTINRADVSVWLDHSDQNLIPAALVVMLVVAILSRRTASPVAPVVPAPLPAPGRRIALLTLGFWLLALLPVYLSTPGDVAWRLMHSADRVVFQIVPAAALLLASLLATLLASGLSARDPTPCAPR